MDLARFARAAENMLGPRVHGLDHLLVGLFPFGVALALGLILVGGLLAAMALGLPRGGAVGAGIPAPVPARPASPGVAVAATVLALILSVVTVVLLRAAPHDPRAVVAWVASVASAGVGRWLLDRARGTRFGNPLWSRREALITFGLMVSGLLFIAYDLSDWHWSGTPDESYFFMFARNVAEGRAGAFPLSEEGVFGYHPVLSSYFQVAFMKVLGTDIFGWRMSSAACLALSLGFIYLLVRELWGPLPAVAAAVLLGSQPLAVAYSHFGYNNSQVYPVVTGSLAIAAWALPRRSLAGLYVAGCVAGLGFHTFYSARLAPLFVLWFGLVVGGVSVRRGRRGEMLALLLGIGLAVVPALAHPEATLGRMLRQTTVTGGRAMSTTEWSTAVHTVLTTETAARVWQHWTLSILHPLWEKCPGRFQPSMLIDPISSALVAVGFWLTVGGLWRDWGSRFLLPAYVLAAFVNGAISQHDCPPLTRLLALAPFLAMFAALALGQLASRVGQVVRWRAVSLALVVAVSGVAAVWNVTALWQVVYGRNHGYGDGTTSELIRIVQQLPANCHIVYVQHVPTSMGSLDMILPQYRRGDRFTHLHPTATGVPPVPFTVQPPLVVLHDLREPGMAAAVEAPMEERFPGRRFQDSAAGQGWNLRYLYVPDGK